MYTPQIYFKRGESVKVFDSITNDTYKIVLNHMDACNLNEGRLDIVDLIPFSSLNEVD